MKRRKSINYVFWGGVGKLGKNGTNIVPHFNHSCGGGIFDAVDQPVSGVPESHHLIQAFFAEYFHPFQAVDIKGASRLGIAFQSETAQYGFQADPGLHEIFHGLELILCQFLSGSAKLAVEVIAFFHFRRLSGQ